ncbi:MAG: AAA family ATPase [Nitrospirales bacterium]
MDQLEHISDMRITRIYIEGFKRFTQFELELNPTFNVIVGDNETGKSSLLEAIGLVLTGQYDGRLIQYALDPYLFNAAAVAEYFSSHQKGKHAPPPQVLIEAYLESVGKDPALAKLKGTNNTRGEDCPGLSMKIEVDSNYAAILKEYAADVSNPNVLPVEFFKTAWRSFGENGVTLRKLPFRAAIIDTSLGRVYRGPNKYLAQVVNNVLTEHQRRDLSLEYKRLQHGFSQEPGVKSINKHLEKQGNPATAKKLSVQMDMSSRTSWDSAITAHLDDLPFDCAGKGEQCRVQLRLAIAGAEESQILLIEEPENHLSHSHLNMLMEDIRKDCADRQVIITTHSGFVLNKLGIDNLRLISHDGQSATLHGLTAETKDYFMKLPGYDTLRLILSKKSILVEGPSDELIVQRAYKDKYKKLPLENGVDVISVGSLAFKRFLEIAELLNLEVRVVTDNDGNVAALKAKYSPFLNKIDSTIRIFFDEDETCPTLEPQLLKANSLDMLNNILKTKHADTQTLLKYMGGKNKTDCALKMFETEQSWVTPEYIINAIK